MITCICQLHLRPCSISDGIDKGGFSLHYAAIDDAVSIVQQLGSGTLSAKINIKSAFRTIPVCLEDRELLGMHWRQKYYVDCCLPFGLRSAPDIFNKYATALVRKDTKTQLSNSQHHPLPRRLLAGLPQSTECGESLHRMQHVRTQLDFPIAENKIEGPTTIRWSYVILKTNLTLYWNNYNTGKPQRKELIIITNW